MIRRIARTSTLVIAMALVTAACTGGGQRATVITTTTTLNPPTTTEDPAAGGAETEPNPAPTTSTPLELEGVTGGVEYGEAASDRIAVATQGGSIILIDPDGSNELVLHDGADGLGAFPVWAPSGERIAWALVAPGAFGQTEYSMESANVDGSSPASMMTPFASYYAAWDSSSSVLAVLGNDATGTATALAVGLADRDSVASPADVGAPSYYFSWDPFGPSIFAHTSTGARLVTPGQEPRELGVGQGLYQPPLLTGEPGILVFGQGGDALGVLRQGNLVTSDVQNLVAYQGNAWMMMHPEGTHVAIQTTGRFTEPDAETEFEVPDDLEMLVPGVRIIELATGKVTDVDDDPVAAFFWSPDGDKLLLADFQPIDGRSFIQWKLYENGEVRTVGEAFSPSTIFGGRILPFFDQYALSASVWAPDSTRFTYSGRDENGEEGVFVYDLDADTASLVHAGGTLAFWSPT